MDKRYSLGLMRTLIAALALALNFLPGVAEANIGVPMVAVFLPPLWLALLPVIAVEAWVLTRLISVSPVEAVKAAALGNVLSTIVGIPIMWLILATVQLSVAGDALGLATPGTRIYAVTVQAPWLIPYEEHLGWMIPVALAVLAVPAYALSVVIEWRALLPFVSVSARAGAFRAVAVANLASYALLGVLFILALHNQAALRETQAVFMPVVNWFVESVFKLAQVLHGGGPQ